MYLISLYFDDKTNEKINQLKKQIMESTKNFSVKDIPCHITLASFYCEEIENILNDIDIKEGIIDFVSIGIFKNTVFIQPIVNDYLQETMIKVHNRLNKIPSIKKSNRYLPNQWICHVTIGKHLTDKEILSSIESIQNEFKPFKGKIIKIGLAKSNPYHDIYIKSV